MGVPGWRLHLSRRARREAEPTASCSSAPCSTAIRGYRLSDGAILGLAVATFADRTGRLYGGKIPPDESVEPAGAFAAAGAAVEAAQQWIDAHPACAE